MAEIYSLLNFKVHGDHSGCLVSLEQGADFPFSPKRVYYIWGTEQNVVRGRHAHKKLEQVIVCVSGSCDFILDMVKSGRWFVWITQRRGFISNIIYGANLQIFQRIAWLWCWHLSTMMKATTFGIMRNF